jgi:hypothetical protein
MSKRGHDALAFISAELEDGGGRMGEKLACNV